MFKLVFKKIQNLFKKDETVKTGLRISRRKLGFEVLEGRELLSAGGFGDNYIYDSNEYEQSSYYESGLSNYSSSQTGGYFMQSSSVTIPEPLFSHNQDIVLDGTGGSFMTISDTSDLDTISSQVTFRSVFTAANTSGFKYLIAHDVENNVGKELFMRIRNGNLQFGTWTGVHTGGTNYLVETAVTVGQTYDAIGTYDGQYWRLYLNGELVSSLQDVGRDISVPSDFNNGSFNPVWLIGAHGTPTDRRIFNGTIQGVEIFDTALTSEQITALHEQKDDWTINLSGPTATNGVTPIFNESTQDSFDVTITRENTAINADKTYFVEVRLSFSGTATKDDFQIFNGTTLISDNTEDWLNNNTVFLCYIPAGETSLTLTFKLVDNQFMEDQVEDLTISVSNASANINGTDKDFTCGTNTVTVKIKNDPYSVQWQTITGTDANKATLSADPEGRGQRVFPEKSTPTGEIENEFELVFTLEAAATTNTTLYFKIFDPDNFIGLGSNDNNATGYVIDDNYATQNVLNPISVEIAAGQQTATLTVVFYPDMYSGMKLIGDESTIVIESAHAGDNFIVVVDTVQTNVNNAALGTTETTRYKEINNLTQSELLTVWRTLNVELDVAAWTGMPTGDLKAPLDGFVESELARACIVTKEFTPNNTSAPNVGDDGVVKGEDDTLLGRIGNSSGRDIPANSQDFWTVRIVTIPYYNYGTYTSSLGAFTPSTNTIAICYQKISDAVTSWNATHDPDVDLQDTIRQVVLHEIGHVLIDENHTTEQSIMMAPITIGQRALTANRKFLATQIQLLQNHSRARD